MVKINTKHLADDVVLFLVRGGSVDDAISKCIAAGESKESARVIVDEARKQITLAADYVRDEQLNKAITRVDKLFLSSNQSRDYKTALQAQRELNKLLGLYSGRSEVAAATDAESEKTIKAIEGYVLPLGLADTRYPLLEHVRIAAEKIRQQAAI